MTVAVRAVLAAAIVSSVAGCHRTPVYDQVVTTDVVSAIELKLERCDKTEGALACHLTVMNRGDDARLVFTDQDVAIWGDGMKLPLKGMSFAGAPTVAVNTTVRSGVPQRLELTLTGADASLRTLRLIEIKAAVLDRGTSGGNDAPRAFALRNLRVN